MRKIALLAALPVSLLSIPASAQVAAIDYSGLTDAVDFSSTITAILAVGALAVTLSLVVVGIRKIMRMIRSA